LGHYKAARCQWQVRRVPPTATEWPDSDLAESESESTSGSLGTRKIRHVPPGPPVPGGILLPPMGSMGHRPRLGPPPKAAAAIAAPKRGQSSEKGTELCSSGTIGAHAQNGETATETNGDKGAAARKPQQPLQSPMATFKTLVVLSILALLAVANAQNATRPTRGPITPPTRPPSTDRPSRVRSPRGAQCGGLGACFDFPRRCRSCSFSGARRRNGAPNQDARREWHRTSNQGAHRRYGEADAGITPTRSALVHTMHASPTTPWPPQRPPSRRTAASLLPCAAGAIRCALAGASCRHREAHSRTTDASAACSRHDSCTCSRHDGRHECATKSPRGGLEAAGGGEQRQRKQRRCATRDSARRVERQ